MLRKDYYNIYVEFMDSLEANTPCVRNMEDRSG